MTPETLLSHLEALDIKLWHHQGKLRCNAPKGVLTAALRQSITAHRADLLRLLAERSHPNTRDLQTIPLVARNGELPLSFSQARIWALNRVDPESNATGNLPFAFRLTGALNVAALKQSLNALIQRHEVFRIGCQTVDGRPVQTILPSIQFHLPVGDLRDVGLPERDETVRKLVKQSATAPFDLSAAPILRARLLHIEEETYLFLLTTHVYVFDGWSTAILFKEISTLYADFSAGRVSTLPALPVQYGDFAHWYRQWLTDKVFEAQQAYWQETLQGVSLPIDLPIDRPRKATLGHQSAEVTFTMPDFLAGAVRELARQEGTTCFITLLAAYQALLYRYTHQATIAIGTIVSNRKVAETETMIGSFANNILFRSDFATDLTFQALLVQVRQRAQAAYSRQDLPFESLLGTLPGRLNRTPFFRVMFLFHQQQAMERPGLNLADLTVEKLPLEKGRSKYELNLVMTDFNDVLAGTFEYSTDLFDQATIQKVIENYLIILKEVTANPTIKLSELPWFRPEKPQVWAKASESGSGAQTKIDYVAPRTQVEATIAQIWQELFDLEEVGVHDNFFALGGHSLLAVRILAAIEGQFEVKLNLKSIFDFPTIAEFARLARPKQL